VREPVNQGYRNLYEVVEETQELIQRQVVAYRKKRSVVLSENDVGRRARVTRDEERVGLHLLRGG